MSLWNKLRYLRPSVRRAADRDMREELDALRAIAGPGALGNLTLAAEDARAEMGWAWPETMAQDIRYGLRGLARDKVFACLAVTSLALGLGANTAIYSLVESVLLRPLPVADPQALVVMKWRAKGYALASTGMSWSTGGSSDDAATGTTSSIFPYPALAVFQDSADVLAATFGYYASHDLSVTAGDATDSLLGQYVSGRYFDGMGVAAAAGRLLQEGDDRPESMAVAVVSHRYGVRRFGGAQAAVGQAIRINERPFVIVGVVPATFFGAEPGAVPDIYAPIHAGPMTRVSTDEHFYWLEIMGRRHPGVSVDHAQTMLAPRFRGFVQASATSDQQRRDLPQLVLQDGATGLDSLRRRYAQPIYVLMGMAALILLIACANIANLLLARGAARRREMAVRLSLGASRWRLTRQLLTESVLLSLVGGGCAVVVAWWGAQAMTQLLANGQGNFTLHASVNWHVLLVTASLSMLTGVLFGLMPALQATRVDVTPALKGDRPIGGGAAMRRRGVGPVLVVAQMVLSLLLLVSAALFERSLASLHAIDVGFARDHVLLATVRPPMQGYANEARLRLFEGLRDRLRALPGVRAVSLSVRPLPMGGGTMAPVTLTGASPSASPPAAVLAAVGPTFFATMQIPLLAGRDLTARDDGAVPRVVVINRRLAELLGVRTPVGQAITWLGQRFDVVGVVENALSFNLKEARRPAVYQSYLQMADPPGEMTYEVRTAGNPLDLAASVREVIRQADSRIAVHDLKTQTVHVDQAISTEITLATLCSMFAGLALVIACVGLYGTVTFTVARRTNEIGIRAALGASANRILWMILRDLGVLAIVAVAIGIPLALLGSRYVKSFLYGIAPNDPTAIVAATCLLLFAGLIAGFIPARRGARIDPLRAIRAE